MIHRTERGLSIKSETTVIEIDEGRLVSIRSARTGKEFLDRSLQEGVPIFDLYHQSGKVSPLGVHPLASRFHYHLLTDRIAEMVLEDWECDVSVRISIDEETGDVLLEPSAWTMQGGVAGLGMHVAGIRGHLDLIAPFQQGYRGPVGHPQVQGTRATWPDMWEAGVVSFAGPSSGFSVQAHDSHFIYKGVNVGHEACAQAATFVTYARGPLERNRCVGNLCWRIAAYSGDWQTPFLQYRRWYWQAYSLEKAASLCPQWLDKIALGVSWCPTNLDLLDALAHKAPPERVFLHLPFWRTSAYDQDYPTYVASASGRAFIAKARGMGYHVAPHTNHCQMSPDHPFFHQARDFCTRTPTDARWGGWSWLPVEGWKAFGPPQSYSTIAAVKDWTVLVNVHLAWSPWRRHLTRQIADLIGEHGLDSIFMDVVHLIHNSDNAMLEGLSYPEGSLKLGREIGALAPGLCVCGEGRNEITTQFNAMVQYHLYKYASELQMDGLDVSWLDECTTPVSGLIFGGLSRGIGYTYGKGSSRRTMIDASLKQGAIPTLIFGTEDPVAEIEGEECRYILDHVNLT
jgi:hypothetical protein